MYTALLGATPSAAATTLSVSSAGRGPLAGDSRAEGRPSELDLTKLEGRMARVQAAENEVQSDLQRQALFNKWLAKAGEEKKEE